MYTDILKLFQPSCVIVTTHLATLIQDAGECIVSCPDPTLAERKRGLVTIDIPPDPRGA